MDGGHPLSSARIPPFVSKLRKRKSQEFMLCFSLPLLIPSDESLSVLEISIQGGENLGSFLFML